MYPIMTYLKQQFKGYCQHCLTLCFMGQKTFQQEKQERLHFPVREDLGAANPVKAPQPFTSNRVRFLGSWLLRIHRGSVAW